MPDDVTRSQLAQWLAKRAQVAMRAAEPGTPVEGWDVELPDSEDDPDNFAVVNAAGELRFTVQVLEW